MPAARVRLIRPVSPESKMPLPLSATWLFEPDRASTFRGRSTFRERWPLGEALGLGSSSVLSGLPPGNAAATERRVQDHRNPCTGGSHETPRHLDSWVRDATRRRYVAALRSSRCRIAHRRGLSQRATTPTHHMQRVRGCWGRAGPRYRILGRHRPGSGWSYRTGPGPSMHRHRLDSFRSAQRDLLATELPPVVLRDRYCR